MKKVDHIGMAVSQRGMPVRMMVRFWSLPAFVSMLMVLVVDMQVPMFPGLVQVV